MFRNTLLLTTISIIVITGWCYAIQVDGHCYLRNQTNHDSIKVLFWESYNHTPLDSTYTDSTGYYQIDVASGSYDIQFRHLGYYNHEMLEQYIGSNITFRNIFLLPAPGTPIQGSLSGTLPADTFLVWDNIEVESGQNLTLQPGTVFLFDGRYRFEISGTLLANGCESDSIKFISSPVNQEWRGMLLRESEISILEYCLVSGSLYSGITVYSNSTIRHCTITGNSNQNGYGGGIVCWNSDPTIEYCTITDNDGASYGGGILCNPYANPVIRYCTISNNTAREGAGIHLGAVAGIQGRPIIEHCIISGNTTQHYGEGGGIYCSSSGGPTIRYCTITNNISRYGGGIYSEGGSDLIIDHCEITENHACSDGGGIDLHNSSPPITNCTISANYAGSGGGIHLRYSSSSIINSIISGNTAGGGIYFRYQTADVSVTYSDVSNNNEGDFVGLYVPQGLGQIVTVNANGDSCDIFYNIFLNPMLTGNYHLQAGSPCIDAGDPTYPYDPDSTIADIGAFYFNQLTVPDPNYPPTQPSDFCLYQNYPNPFNPITTIGFAIPYAAHTTLKVFDITGRQVTTLVNGWRTPGIHKVILDGSNLATGIYFARLKCKNYTQAQKMLLLK